MAGEVVGAGWETQAEVDAVLAEVGATMDRFGAGDARGCSQETIRLDDLGSVVRYPKGTCAQIRAITALFKEKDRVNYVGAPPMDAWLSGR